MQICVYLLDFRQQFDEVLYSIPIASYDFALILLGIRYLLYLLFILFLSHDVASGSKITPCNKIDKPLVVYIFSGHVMASITTLDI